MKPRDQFDPDKTVLSGQQGEDDETIVNPPMFTPADPTPAAGGEELAIGTVVKDRFVIEGVVGRGGMGVVYLAKDLRKEEAHDRDPYVAFKVLNDEYRLNPAMVIALQREARKAQSLAHPAITTVYDFDRDADMVYITMEMLDGQPLDDVIADHPEGMPKKEVFSLVRGLCLGLAYAHNKNIIHSDFKPGNVFRTSDDRVKILDFGIARAAPMAETEDSVVTRFDAGDLGALTPAYAATEMWAGADPHPSDDVYALALVTYELLTGHHPFHGSSALQAKANGLKPAPIAHLKRREWRAIQHGLAFDRKDRTAHAAEFLRELEGVPKLRAFLGATAVALVLSLSYVTFQEYQNIAALMPDVAFEDLPVEDQRSITALLNDARTLEGFGDLSSALEFYVKAYRAHPRNSEAVDGITHLAVTLSEAALSSGRPDDFDAVKANIEAIMNIDDYLAKNEILVESRDAIIEIQ
ncbi:MAG: serine/threonine-protein kinase [Pseudomonadales bacterium]